MTDSLTMMADVSGAVQPAAYTVPEGAHRANCSPRHLWRQIDLGHVPGVIRIGRLVRLHRATFDAWLAAGAPPQRRTGR